jgi:hypothetical protein
MMSPHRHPAATTCRNPAHARRQPARGVVSAVLAGVAILGVAAGLAATGVAHAQAGDNPFVAFLKGLFGVEQRREPKRWRPPARRAFPRASMILPQSGTATPESASPPVETFRTMCVRLCDGYYWPVSFATTRATFERDARTCAQSCSGSVALYYYPNPGGELEAMVNLEGQPYKSLGTAFLYRSTYDANCKCRPHPWEAEAVERHKSYAKSPQVSAAARGGRRGR